MAEPTDPIAAKKNVIRLAAGDDSPVFVSPQDKDNFITTASFAAQACKSLQEVIEVYETFKRFWRAVHDWSEKHVENVRAAYIGTGDSGYLKVFVIVQGDKYRYDLEDALVDLRYDLHARFPHIPCDVLQLPDVAAERLSGFFPPSATAVFDCQASKNT